jgi:hypothetical protein
LFSRLQLQNQEISPKKDCEHSYSQENQKKRNTGSKKLGCTAAVYMREIVFFPRIQGNVKLFSFDMHMLIM